MKFFNLVFIALFALAFLACGSDTADQSQTPETSTTETTPAVTTPQSSTLQNTSSNGKLNPAHGEPGHRCDIAVGAPLDSAPAAAQTQSPLIQTQQPAATTTTPVTVAEGMNPAHGQPGHRCDIAVGAPLNSAPKQ